MKKFNISECFSSIWFAPFCLKKNSLELHELHPPKEHVPQHDSRWFKEHLELQWKNIWLSVHMLTCHKLTYFSSDLEMKTYEVVMFIVLIKKIKINMFCLTFQVKMNARFALKSQSFGPYCMLYKLKMLPYQKVSKIILIFCKLYCTLKKESPLRMQHIAEIYILFFQAEIKMTNMWNIQCLWVSNTACNVHIHCMCKNIQTSASSFSLSLSHTHTQSVSHFHLFSSLSCLLQIHWGVIVRV